MKFILNGKEKIYNGRSKLTLLKYLREVEGITSVKDGCSGQASCGSCTVQIDGKAALSCIITMEKLDGKNILTIEGIDEKKRKIFANAFTNKGAVQCGFCTPGIIMQANALLAEKPTPTKQDISLALRPNLCRCTGYKKIIEAIQLAADAIDKNKTIELANKNSDAGKRYPKYKSRLYALGEARFIADIKIKGMLYGALKFSDYPRAKILKIDLSRAEQLEGVIKVFTANDIPGKRNTGLIINDWPIMLKEGEETRYVGDVLASVVATDEETARRAVRLIKIEYEILKPVTDPFEALKKDAPRIHPSGNLLSQTVIKRGNVDEAIENSAFVTTARFQTQRIEHGYLEPEASIAYPDSSGEGIEILSQGQGVYEDRRQIASVLNLPEEKVRVKLIPNGGGFGGKEDLSVQHHAALCAYILKKPVKFVLTREESIIMHPKRHPMVMDYTLACDANGKLTAIKAKIIGDTGAYASVGMKVLERAAGHATGAYHIPNAFIISKAVYTNNAVCGAMRGFGVNQVTFAIEQCIDQLCEMGGFDRWQFRYNNALTNGSLTATGQILNGGVGVRETLLAVKNIFQNARFAGIACGIKNTGIGNGMPDESEIKIEVADYNKIILHHGWTEMGQGVNTMAVQFLATETGLNPDIIEVKVDTQNEARAGMTTASRATSLIGNAIIEAAKEFKKDLQNNSLKDLIGKIYRGKWICDWTTKPEDKTQNIVTHYSYSYATQVVILNDNGEIQKIVAAHDAGKIINPNLFEGQIEGALHMGLGYAISENLEFSNGFPKTTNYRKMGILRSSQMPEVEVIGVEVKDPVGPYGAKGVGEIGLVPTAAAVANAFCQYDGKRYFSLPIKNRVKKSKSL